jgi:hypothetical protein
MKNNIPRIGAEYKIYEDFYIVINTHLVGAWSSGVIITIKRSSRSISTFKNTVKMPLKMFWNLARRIR